VAPEGKVGEPAPLEAGALVNVEVIAAVEASPLLESDNAEAPMPPPQAVDAKLKPNKEAGWINVSANFSEREFVFFMEILKKKNGGNPVGEKPIFYDLGLSSGWWRFSSSRVMTRMCVVVV
jgi:hypothetical protein